MYRPSKGDLQIFKLAEEDPDLFSNYYLRNETSGTWWLPGATFPRFVEPYKRLVDAWHESLNAPEFDFMGHTYITKFDHERSKEFPDAPAFFHNHGLLFLPYHKMLHFDRTTIRTIIGGFGSAKTFGQILTDLVNGCMMTNYRSFFLAPESAQAEEGYVLALQMMEGTLFQERFLISHRISPRPRIVFGHEGVGESMIEFFPMKHNEHKLRTLTGDRAIIDQAEHHEMDLAELIRSVGTRFRGRIPRDGRERVGTITLLANSADNLELWDIYDKAEEDPENYLSLSPSSSDNPYLTERDMKRFGVVVGGTEEDKEVYMEGRRPVGDGDHFSKEVLLEMQMEELDQMMKEGLALQEETGEHKGFIYERERRAGVYKWMLPYNPDRKYLVISDAGTKNPPNRDSPVIMVFDITGFPGPAEMPVPMTLVGFWWVFGNNRISNWANAFAEVVHRYKAIGTNGFDATGFQSGYDQWLHALKGLLTEKISMAGNNKALCLNAGKVITTRFLVKTPIAISALYDQMSRYKYPPEPKRLRQDLVMTFIMACWWVQRLFYMSDEPFTPIPNHDPDDRYEPTWEDERFGLHGR